MSDDSGQDKSEAPTLKRREDARKKGQVPRSQEITSAFLLLAAAGSIQFLTGPLSAGLRDLFGGTLGTFDARPEGVQGMVGFIRGLTLSTAGLLAPVVLTLTGVAFASAAVQARGILSLEAVQPKFEKLNPINKAKEIWGPKALMELFKNLMKLALVGGVTWLVIQSAMDVITALGQQAPFALLMVAKAFAVRLLMWVGIAYLAIASIDYAYQIWNHEKSLKMSKQEIKQEHKESEGDQIMKVRRRSLARSMARRRMLLSVSQADVVVTNPTHIAVALKYDPTISDAPIVVAMGERKVAQKIKEIAKKHGVPTVENKPLARALYATAKVGQSIPLELFVAVAEILAFVIRQRGSRTLWEGSARA